MKFTALVLATLMTVSILGCGGVRAPLPASPQDNQTPSVLNPYSEAIAKQAELANESPALEATEVVQGILTEGIDVGIPADFVGRVRSTCPFLQATPPRDLTSAEVQTLRSVH